MVPAYQPYASMQFVMDYIEKGYLYCETESNGSCKSVASDMCDYMNDCNGNGSCNSYGKCECDKDFFGADCSAKVVDLTSASANSVEETVKASRWFYYLIPEQTGDFTLNLNSDREVSVYIRKGVTDLPDTVTFDALVKNEMSIGLSSQMVNFSKGAIVAVHCIGASDDETNFTVQLAMSDVLIELAAAAATPTPVVPKPQFEGGDDLGGSEFGKTDDNFLSHA